MSADVTQTEFPADVVVLWPSGPVPACVEHAKQLVHLSAFLGSDVFVMPLTESAECENCRNEAAKAPPA